MTRSSLDGKSFAIGILSVTACVLLVGYLLLAAQPAPVYATGQVDRGGDYILATQQLSNSQEGVIVIDAAARQMSLYILDMNQRRIRPIQLNIPLSRMPGATGPRTTP